MMTECSSHPQQVEQLYRMVEEVRFKTHLSHKLACHAVYVVMQNLIRLNEPTIDILFEVMEILEAPLEAPGSLVDNTHDMARLHMITENLNSVKNDAQQRSWELFDDKATIIEYLNELNCILADADVAVSKRFLHVTEYYIVICLAEYYQMESRWPIKILLLKTFDVLCSLSATACIILLQSVLPLELARDIESKFEDHSILIPAIDILTKILSVEEPLPVIYFDTIGKEFIRLLLRLIENPYDTENEDVVEHLLNFIVVYNLQFNTDKPISDNITIQALTDAGNPKVFSETLLLLFNRGKDPIECLNRGTCHSNSLLKMIMDIFSHDRAYNLFYNNDIRVLIDIVLRHLTDNVPDIKERNDLLELLRQILSKSEESVYSDRINEIQTCISRFLSEDNEISTNFVEIFQKICLKGK